MTRPPAPGPQASDPAVLTTGQVLPRRAPAPVGGGAFRIDLDRAPRAIAELEDAKRQLLTLKDETLRLGKVTPPARDAVSADAATVLGAVAVGGTGSLLAALDAGMTQIQGLIDAMRAELADYGDVEEDITRSLDAR